jgi:lipoprotein signal peptidase
MSRDTTVPVYAFQAERNDGLRQQQSMVVALFAAVIVLDQATKWWAWRHTSEAIINYGGDPLVGPTVGGWFAGPVTGAVLDVLNVGLLGLAITFLVRRRLPGVVLIPAALMLGGWSANLLDRLGLHYWTAPGSVRGAVDFIHLGSNYYNVADFFIIGSTPLCLLGLIYLGSWTTKRRALAGSVTPKPQRRLRARTRMLVLAGAIGLCIVVGIGATHYGGVTDSVASASVSTQ